MAGKPNTETEMLWRIGNAKLTAVRAIPPGLRVAGYIFSFFLIAGFCVLMINFADWNMLQIGIGLAVAGIFFLFAVLMVFGLRVMKMRQAQARNEGQDKK
jgi:hypothetical protein